MSKGAHQNNRRFGSTISATKKYKDAGVQFSPHGKDVTIPYGKWTDAMKTLSEYAALLHKVAHGVECSVKWVNDSRNYGACYSTDCVMFNKRRLGTRWIEDAVRGNGGVDVSGFHRFVDLCIHEFAHRHSLSHYSDNFYKGCTRIGAAVAVHLGQNGLPDFLYD